MPINPQIPLSVHAPQMPNPLEIVSTISQIQAQREAVELRRLAADEARTKKAKAEQVDAALRDSITIGADGEITIDPAKVMAHLPNLGGAAALELQQTIADNQTKANAAKTSQAALFKAHQELYGSLAQRAINSGGDPAIWSNTVDLVHQLQQSLPAKLRTMDDATHQRLRAVTDPQEILQLAKGYMDGAAAKSAEIDFTAFVRGIAAKKGVPVTALSPEDLLAARTQWETAGRAGQTADQVSHQSEWVLLPGQSEPVLASYNPKTKELLHQGKDISAIARRVPPPLPQGPYMWAVSPGGEAPTLQTPGEIRGGGAQQPPPAITEAQGKAAGYATRLAQAEPTITELATPIKDMNFVSFGAQTNSWFKQPTFQSNEVQKYMQAASNFINAVLRRESGAVISPTEFAEAKSQYLPLPGNTEEVLAQKKANRELVFENMRREAGRAYVAPAVTGQPKEGDVKPIPGHPGTEQTYKNGKWIRTK